MTQRWVFAEPLDPDTTYTFERNPTKMDSPNRVKQIDTVTTGAATADIGIRARKQPDGAFTWSFSGRLASQEMHDALLAWSQKEYVITVTDDLDRTYTILPIVLDVTDHATARHPWRHNYTFKAYLFPDGADDGSTVSIDTVDYTARPSVTYVVGNPYPPPVDPGTPDPTFPPSGPPVPVTPDHTTDFGTAMGANLTWQITNFPNAKSVRHYDSGNPRNYAAGTQAQKIHAGCPEAVLWQSAKPDVAATIAGTNNAMLDAWIASWTFDVVLCLWHEPEQGIASSSPRISAADYVSMQNVFLARVAAVGNAHVKTFGCLMSFTFSISGGTGHVNDYFKPGGVLLGFDYFGFDSYNQTHTNDAMAWAQGNSVNWAINEWGVANSGTPISDATAKADLIAAKAAWASYPPAAFQYFDSPNAGVNDAPNLPVAPLTNAYLKGLAGP